MTLLNCVLLINNDDRLEGGRSECVRLDAKIFHMPGNLILFVHTQLWRATHEQGANYACRVMLHLDPSYE